MPSLPTPKALTNGALRAAPGLIAGVAFASVPTLRGDRDYVVSVVWGLILLVSYVGWGKLYFSLVRRAALVDWGLAGAVGVALSLAVGGFLMMLHLARAAPLLVWTAGGLVCWGIVAVRAGASERQLMTPIGLTRASRNWGIWTVYGLYGVLFAFRYLGAVANISFNQWDDNMAYRGFATQILGSGTLIEPFSYHRIGSYCGQSLLHAMALVLSGPTRLHIVDEGIGMLLLVGLVVGYRDRYRAGAICALTLLATLPYETHNIQSTLTGAVLFLAVFRTMDAPGFATAPPMANALTVGLLGAGVCTLRQNYIAPMACLVLFYYVSSALSNRAQTRRFVREAIATGLVTVAALAPWALLSYESAKTFLYPVMRGTTNPDFGILGKVTRYEEARWIIDNVDFCWPIRTIPLLILAGLLTVHRSFTRALHALLFGVIVGFFLLIHFFQAFHLADSLGRYYLAFGLAYALAIALKSGAGSLGRGMTAPAVLVLGSLVVQVFDVRDKATHLYTSALDDIEDELKGAESVRFADVRPLQLADFYRRMQAVVPEGERLLVMANETYLFDTARNRVWNFDQPGALSPAPGVPYFQGDEALATYFTSIGVRYIAFVVSDSSPEYSIAKWTAHMREPEQKSGRGNMYRKQGTYYVDAFQNLLALTHTRKVLFHENDYWVLDLETREPH